VVLILPLFLFFPFLLPIINSPTIPSKGCPFLLLLPFLPFPVVPKYCTSLSGSPYPFINSLTITDKGCLFLLLLLILPFPVVLMYIQFFPFLQPLYQFITVTLPPLLLGMPLPSLTCWPLFLQPLYPLISVPPSLFGLPLPSHPCWPHNLQPLPVITLPLSLLGLPIPSLTCWPLFLQPLYPLISLPLSLLGLPIPSFTCWPHFLQPVPVNNSPTITLGAAPSFPSLLA
jgi:hypothetical protein